MESSISDVINSLKCSISESDYDRIKRYLSFYDTKVKSEKAELSRKFDNAVSEIDILTKQLEQYKKDHGELLLANNETRSQLNESISECAHLRASLAAAIQEANLKIVECEVLKKKNAKLEEEVKEVKKYRAEHSKLTMEKAKLGRDLASVMAAANQRFKSFEKRVSDLERDIVNGDDDASNNSDSGSQLVATTQVKQVRESVRPEVTSEGIFGVQSGHQTTPIEDESHETASMMPSSKATSATCVQGESESFESGPRSGGLVGTHSFSEIPTAEDKFASSTPCSYKYTSAPFVVNICSSDDDGEPPLPKGLKKKLPSSEVSNKRQEDCGCFSKYRLKQCEHKAGVTFNGASKNLKKRWECEADILEDLQKDTELCMKGVCSLYRQHMFYFSSYMPMETTLAKFLTDGNAQGGLKKTLAELKEFDPKGEDDCKRIAVAHSKRLFDIYKNGKDPFFAPDITSC